MASVAVVHVYHDLPVYDGGGHLGHDPLVNGSAENLCAR